MLTDTECKAAKPRERPFKLFDAHGLFLLVMPTGGKLWRYEYRRHGGRRNTLSFGKYPLVKLAEARDKRDAARRQLAVGRDPSLERKRERAAQGETFKLVAEEWLQLQEANGLSKATLDKARWLLGLVYGDLGNVPVKSITAPDILRVLKRVESGTGRERRETARRVRQRVSAVLRHAVGTFRLDYDLTASLPKDVLKAVNTKNRAAIVEPKRVGELLRALDTYQGQPAVMYALRLAPYLFVRPGELRAMEWSELDLDAENPTWRIPAARTKMRKEHLVPLSRQAVALLTELRGITHYSRFAFPSLRTKERCMSETALTAALARLGYSGNEQTPHGFRTTASTLLHERGYEHRDIELQLAHQDPDRVSAAYNKAERLAERRKLVQAYADYLDVLRADTGNNVVALNRGRA